MCKACSGSQLSYGAYSATEISEPVHGGSGSNFWATQGSTSNTNINGVLSGNKWGGTTLTYSFPTSTAQYDAGYGDELNAFSEAGAGLKTATRFAMDLVSQYTNLVTTEVDPSTTMADVRTANYSNDTENPTAYAYYPSDGTKGGDIWYGTAYPQYQNPVKGQYAWTTVIHELGHSLGLKHGHQTGGVAGTAMQTAFDQMAYSVMTYRSYQGGPATGYTNETNGYATTFMMYDIAALQVMYGANFNTNSGNTTYTWSATTGEMSINGVAQGAPGGNRIFMTIWDGNGVDTYDFSNYSTNLTVNLAPGSFSITSATQLANLGSGNIAPGNIFNALQYNGDVRSLIENAVGGSGNDTITGNNANNILMGGSGTDQINGGFGDDQLYGGLGADALDGGDGFDLARYDHATSGVTARLDYASLNLGEALGDTYSGIEGMVGSAHADFLVGNTANNYLNGSLGDDYLAGVDGDDNLIGDFGNDQFWGGNGADSLNGGDGFDVARYDFAATGVIARLDGGANSGEAFGDTFFSVEALYGSAYSDFLIGNNTNNVIAGLDGADYIYGLGGDDYLLGGNGADYFGYNTNAFGNDTITDFATSASAGLNHDIIDLRGLSLSLFSITQSGADTLITTNAGTIRLSGVNGTTLTASDFLF